MGLKIFGDRSRHPATGFLRRAVLLVICMAVAMPSALSQESERRDLVAVKTNLLFDAVTAVNLEVEAPVLPGWSVAGELVFPWWISHKRQRAFEMYLGTVEVRWWPGHRNSRRAMTGWFAGVYGGGGRYDIEWENEGYQGSLFHVGVSGGFAHSINNNGNLRMEYSLGLGYMGSGYRRYVPVMGEDERWNLVRVNNGTYRWIGPTRAKVSLVWMFDAPDRRKGGVR